MTILVLKSGRELYINLSFDSFLEALKKGKKEGHTFICLEVSGHIININAIETVKRYEAHK